MSLRRGLSGILQTLACRHVPGALLLRHLTILRSSYIAGEQSSVPYSGLGKPVVSGSAPKEAHGSFSMGDSSKARGFKSLPEGDDHVSFSFSDSHEEMEFPGASAQNKVQIDKKEYPRPAEIPWQKKVANSVNLIGRLGLPVHLDTFPDGSAYATVILEQKKTPNFPQLWIPVIFQGDLAGIAACHLKENDHIHVSGLLSADSPQIVIEDRVSTVHVMAQSLSFVHEKPQGEGTEPLHKRLSHATRLAVQNETKEDSWKDLIDNPDMWWDNRLGKKNPKAPDFKHKESGKGLWLDSSPDWARSKLLPVQ